MSEHSIAHIVFLSQVLFGCYFFPKIVLGRLRYIYDTYPPANYPRLYPKPIRTYESGLRRYRYTYNTLLVVGLLIFAAMLAIAHDGDVDNAIVMGYFFVQSIPLILLDVAALKDAKMMRQANSARTRAADLRPRRFFDFVSPVFFGTAVFVYVAFVVFIAYIDQFRFPWFGGYLNVVGVTATNLFLAAIMAWKIYGKKTDPHQSDKDRATHIATTIKIMLSVSIAMTLFLIIDVTLSALDMRHLMPITLSLYFQILIAISIKAYDIDHRNFEVYKEGPSVV